MRSSQINSTQREKLQGLLDRPNVSIALIDSGLGGLSICAEMEQALARQPLFRKASLIYFNVWPEQHRGFNSLDSVAERVRVFDRALDGIKAFGPDLIMIACNTLSALYGKTAFCRHTVIPVVDIIDFGVDMLHASLVDLPKSQALILGTRTTISENCHQDRLIEKGIAAGRITSQVCHGVATEIEKDPEGPAVADLIDGYVREAAVKIQDRGQTLFAALCCTHFGYSSHIFAQKLKAHIADNVEVLNPNSRMCDFLFSEVGQWTVSESDIDVRVISRIVLTDNKIRSISNLIRGISAKTAAALEKFVHQPDLFKP